jgi:hypothetical protein
VRLNDMLVLDDEGKTPGILLLVGLPRTGKDALLRAWMKADLAPASLGDPHGLPEIGYAEIWRSRADTLGRKVYVTPITCVAFSEIAYGLGQVAARSAPVHGLSRKWYREPKALYTDAQFCSLLDFVRDEVKRLRIRAIVVNNAHFLDPCALEMLVLLRRQCNDRISFILCAQMAENAKIDEPLKEPLIRVPEAAKMCRTIELQRLSKRVYKAEVLPALRDDLALSFADDLKVKAIALQVPDALWKYTGYDWQAIDDLAREIKRKVPDPGAGQRRVLTRAVLEEILGKHFNDEPDTSR